MPANSTGQVYQGNFIFTDQRAGSQVRRIHPSCFTLITVNLTVYTSRFSEPHESLFPGFDEDHYIINRPVAHALK